ncbi:unnamed protein product [Vicia faba]|uniref:Uncharacterized protein n=1 Tax=Vicia faba TaxID=3906 RepID=A0AAV0YNM9_VICFA|nr:unnamed protein product [Vicia faba]
MQYIISASILPHIIQPNIHHFPTTVIFLQQPASASISTAKHPFITFSDSSNLSSERRPKLYEKMARDLDEHGAAFLKHGETSQSLSISDIFTLNDGSVTPVLKPANPPNSSMYHFSMFHASHHIVPVPATKQEIEAEASSVETVAARLCPLNIVLDRVVLTSTGVLLGCWKVISDTDPITIRARLKNVLPCASSNFRPPKRTKQPDRHRHCHHQHHCAQSTFLHHKTKG